MKITATIEARMTSSRLPGKVLMPFGGVPALEVLVKRVSRARYIDEIVVATTVNDTDEPIAALCKKLGVACWRGSEDDVLQRVLDAAQHSKADLICELMGDSPFIDPLLIDHAITSHLSGSYDYTSNFFPVNTFPLGFAVQVFPVEILERVEQLTQDPVDRSHVSCFIYHNPRLFRLNGVAANAENSGPDIRVALDTQNDYELMTKVFDALVPANPEFRARDVVAYLRENPGLLLLNRHIRPKAIEEG
jgi:spore coat polysaccharide biosynthesis protein SpsF